MSTKPHTSFFPIVSLLLGATLWGVIWYPLRLFEEAGLPGLWVTLLIYVAALPIGLIMFLYRRDGMHQLGWLTVMAVASGWCNVAFILAVLDGNVVRIYLLFYLSPLWTVLFARLLLGERLGVFGWVTLAVAMLGAMIMLYDPAIGLPWPESSADWFAITSGVAFALTNVTVRKLEHESIWTKTVFAWLGIVVLAGVWIMLAGIGLPQVSTQVIGLALLMGAVVMVVMTLIVIYGLTHLPTHLAATILLFELVAATASALWLTNEQVLLNEWLGGLMVLAAGYIAARRQVKEYAQKIKQA